jgi:glutamate dehydrogenase (NAD(P)+)
VSLCIAEALASKGVDPVSSTAIVQGFGNVGSVTAEILHIEMGMKVVGVSDHTAAYYDPRGLPIPELVLHVAKTGGLAGWSTELLTDPADLLTLPCDILAPCAVERVIDSPIAEKLQCRILAEGANGPTTPDADRVLDQRRDEVFLIPDILCNSGGVIVSYFLRVSARPAAAVLVRGRGQQSASQADVSGLCQRHDPRRTGTHVTSRRRHGDWRRAGLGW